MINPTEEQFSEWMQRYYPPPEPQPSRQRRLAELAQQEAMLADLAQTQDPENAAIMQRMAPQPQEMQQRNQLSALAQPQPMNTIKSSSGRTIDLGYAAPGGSGVSPEGFRAKPDPWANGPRELSRKQLQDGTFEVIREYPAVDGFGRQSSKLVREIETPDYLNPAASKQIDFKLKQAQLEKAQAEAQEGMPTEQASQKYLEKKYGKAGPGFRMTESGVAEPIPGGPADQKAQMKASGAADVDIALGTLRDAYNRLESGGGITSTKKGPIDNLGASISASDIGQVAGKAFGTSNQSARNDIAMSRPALLAALMKATGMSARQMDSNVELKLWITTATDPQLDVEANRRALNNIETKYLGGNKAGNNPAEATPSRPTTSGGNTVTLPDGRTLRFPSGAAAEAFHRKAGL